MKTKLLVFNLLGLSMFLLTSCASTANNATPQSKHLLNFNNIEPPSTIALLTLDDYIQYALQNSSALKSAYHSYLAALERSPQTRALPNPRLGYGYFIQPVETRVGPQKHKFSVSQSFPWFGTLRLQGLLSDNEARMEFYRFLGLKNQLVFDIIKTYTELAFVYEAQAITTRIIELIKTWEPVLQGRFRGGSGSHSSLVKLQLELAILEDRIIEYQDLATPLTASLNAALNRDTTEAVTITNKSLHQIVNAFDSLDRNASDLHTSLASNPTLNMLAAAVEAKQTGAQLAEKKLYPSMTLGLDYIETGERDVANGGEDAVAAVVSLDLPLFWEKNQALTKESNLKLSSAEAALAAYRFTLQADFAQSLFAIRNASRRASLYQNTLIPKAEQSIEASYAAYETGENSFQNVIDAENALLEYHLALSRAKANRVIALAKLQQLSSGQDEGSSAYEGKNND